MRYTVEREGTLTPRVGFTYFGQFIGHDLSHDVTPLGGPYLAADKVANYRMPSLNLEQVYGGEPAKSPNLYDGPAGAETFKIGKTVGAGYPRDVPIENRELLIADERNLDNLILRQLHVVFLKFHNETVRQLMLGTISGAAGVAFSALSTYRLFVRGIQRVLWRERFGCQMIFYDEAVLDGSALTDALLETGSDIVIWLMPPLGTSSCFARLRDRGIRSLVITDEMPINGEAGYYLSWQDAVIQGLAEWKRSECAKAVVVKDGDSKSSGALGLMHSCLAEAGLVFEIRDRTQLRTSNRSSNPNAGNCREIFLSAQSLIQFAQAGVDTLADLLRHNRVLFIHGSVDLPFQTKLNRAFDTIKFDWPAIVRRIVRDLVASRYINHIEEQTIFKGEWNAGTTRGVVPF